MPPIGLVDVLSDGITVVKTLYWRPQPPLTAIAADRSAPPLSAPSLSLLPATDAMTNSQSGGAR